jgi:hypothetical protein
LCLNFDTKIYFCYVLIPDWERRERLLDSGGRKKNIVDNNLDYQNNRGLCQIVSFDEKSSYQVFISLKFMEEEKDLNSG